VVGAVRPNRPQGYGSAWEVLCANHDRISTWVDDGLTVVKIGDLLVRQGVAVPQRTLHRYCVARTGYQGRRPAGTVPVVDGEPASRESNQGTPHSFVSGFPRMRVSRACSDHALAPLSLSHCSL
jgi:hypothetical protein